MTMCTDAFHQLQQGAALYTQGLGYGRFDSISKGGGKKKERKKKVLCCDQCSDLREGGGRSEKTTDCTVLYISIFALFLDCCAIKSCSQVL